MLSKYYDFNDILIKPKSSIINSRNDINLICNNSFKNNLYWSGIPIICSNMTTTGTFDVYKVLSQNKIITAFNKFYKVEDYLNYNNNNNNKLDVNLFMISTGISDNDYDNLTNILDNFECKFILIDIANGYIQKFKDFCLKIRKKYTNKIIVAGNVCTSEGVLELINCGVDIIKCGIGGGSACTTRIQTGVGVPQFSCILECSNIAKQHGVLIISDGGITCPGDCAKAFGAGADYVMIGGEFAGHDENPGNIINENGKKYKFFYGMSSTFAMNNNYAANNNNYRTSEGREIKIKYKGNLQNTINNYLGGLRSTCTYTNSKTLRDLTNNCNFILVNHQYNTKFVDH
jgi:GMP reductase